MPRKVDSIGQAVIYMGLRRIRAWVNLLVMAGLKDRPEDHYLMALVRAHLCEKLLQQVEPENNSGFLIGLFSILDLLLNRSLSEILSELSLSDEINAALLEGTGIAGQALCSTLQVEAGEWHLVDYPGVTRDQIHDFYLEASEQAFREKQALLTL
jgi:EAL and modified HD-GYP domain-containing signal transduction protein